MGASEATLLNMLNISPFSFGLVIQQVFDNGSIYNPEVLDITEETLHKRFLEVSATARVRSVPPHFASLLRRPPLPLDEQSSLVFSARSCRARTVCQEAPSVGFFI